MIDFLIWNFLTTLWHFCVATVNISFELVTWATCDGLKVLELYPVKLLKEIELACTFSFLILSTFSDLYCKKRGCCLEKNLARAAQCLFVNSYYVCMHQERKEICYPEILFRYLEIASKNTRFKSKVVILQSFCVLLTKPQLYHCLTF